MTNRPMIRCDFNFHEIQKRKKNKRTGRQPCARALRSYKRTAELLRSNNQPPKGYSRDSDSAVWALRPQASNEGQGGLGRAFKVFKSHIQEVRKPSVRLSVHASVCLSSRRGARRRCFRVTAVRNPINKTSKNVSTHKYNSNSNDRIYTNLSIVQIPQKPRIKTPYPTWKDCSQSIHSESTQHYWEDSLCSTPDCGSAHYSVQHNVQQEQSIQTS